MSPCPKRVIAEESSKSPILADYIQNGWVEYKLALPRLAVTTPLVIARSRSRSRSQYHCPHVSRSKRMPTLQITEGSRVARGRHSIAGISLPLNITRWRPWVTEARIEGLIFKGSLDESQSSISKSEGIMVYDWKNGRIKQGRRERGLMAP
jgi:hypothetical protein